MYLAELHGKLTPRIEKMEDILTSNVFSFFKYSNRGIFLYRYLSELGFAVSEQDAEKAKFIFWPRFEKNTEPDLAIVVGPLYIVIEAKYYSGFSEGTLKTRAQLLREIDEGILESNNYGKQFRLLAITADHYYKEEKFRIIPENILPSFKWTYWQLIASLIDQTLSVRVDIPDHEKLFAADLYHLLEKKSLRGFSGISALPHARHTYRILDPVFFRASTARFRGDFIGFTVSLSLDRKMTIVEQTLFFNNERKRFSSFGAIGQLQERKDRIFLRRSNKND